MRLNRRSLGGTVVALLLAAIGAVFGLDRGPSQPGGRTDPPAARSDPASGPAAAAAISVSPKRRIHILDGDRSGGGHGPGRGTPGKSEFPRWMSDDDVIREVERIANDPASYRDRRVPTGPDRYEAEGSVRAPPGEAALRVKVVVEPRGEGVVTAYPTNVRRNP